MQTNGSDGGYIVSSWESPVMKMEEQQHLKTGQDDGNQQGDVPAVLVQPYEYRADGCRSSEFDHDKQPHLAAVARDQPLAERVPFELTDHLVMHDDEYRIMHRDRRDPDAAQGKRQRRSLSTYSLQHDRLPLFASYDVCGNQTLQGERNGLLRPIRQPRKALWGLQRIDRRLCRHRRPQQRPH